jgi:hypothetical protein
LVLQSNRRDKSVEYLNGAEVKWAGIFETNWGQKSWNILLELGSNRLDYLEWAGVVLDSNRRRVWVTGLEYLDGAEVKWTRKMGLNKGAGIFGRSSMEMESNGLIFGCN